MGDERDSKADLAGGLDLAALGERDRDEPGGEGDLTGGDAGQASQPGNVPVGGGGLPGMSGNDIAVEAASYGPADGALADAAADGDQDELEPGGVPNMAEAIGQGAGSGETGSGTPGDRGETGGGGPGGLQGGTGREGSASPGGGGGETGTG